MLIMPPDQPMIQVLAFLLLVVLVTAGWKQSYRDHYRRLSGPDSPAVTASIAATSTSAPVTQANNPIPEATPRKSRNWMFQDNLHMDKPFGQSKAMK